MQVERFFDKLRMTSLCFYEFEMLPIRTYLECQGTPIGGNDLLIASHALSLNLTVVTHNISEFSRVPNLKIEKWLN